MVNLKEGKYFGESLQTIEDGLFKLSITAYNDKSTTEKHYHENSYLSILTSGKYLENSNGTAQLINVSDVLFRPSSYSHQNTFLSDSTTCFNIEFKKGWEQHLDLNIKLPESHLHYSITDFPSLYKLLLSFKTNYDPGFTTELILDWLFTIDQPKPRRNPKRWVSKIEKILTHETAQFHSLTSLAARVHVHPVYMARAFKEEKGVTIGEFQLQSKLSNALFLLTTTSQTISDISFANGFFDDAHFIRSFKKEYGIAPQRFRNIVKS